MECIFIIGLLINLNFWCYSSDLSGIEIDKKLGFDPEHIPEPIKTKKMSYITLSITPEKTGVFCGILSKEFLEKNSGKVKHVILNSVDIDGKDENKYYDYDKESFIDDVSEGICFFLRKKLTLEFYLTEKLVWMQCSRSVVV